MYVIGTAGHVDHGKSTLVKALTGIDPDRLKEERQRAMTIDLGFAWLTLPSGEDVGIIDVPGHKDFINNMLAGVGGIDAALLIVAADEGVMPQTREHLAILDLLAIERGVVAITKVDLVDDDEWLELIEADLEETLAETALADAPLVRVSALGGKGLKELQRTLDHILANVPERRNRGRPRLPIDRVFTISGFGTVVTGTLQDGLLEVGQEVEIQPQGVRARIRGLQMHKTKIQQAESGSRTAVNLSGVRANDLKRGNVLTSPDWLEPSQLLDVQLKMVPDAPRPLQHNQEVEVFTGATEMRGYCRLLGTTELLPGETGWVQLRLEERIPVIKGDRFIIRQPSPSQTIGGGVIVNPLPKRRHRRFKPEVLKRLETLLAGTPEDVLLAELDLRGPLPIRTIIDGSTASPAATATALQNLLDDEQVFTLAPLNGSIPQLTKSKTVIASTGGWASLVSALNENLRLYHQQYPLRLGVPRGELRSRLNLEMGLFNQAIGYAMEDGLLVATEAHIHLPEHQVRFSPSQQQQIDQLVTEFRRAPYQTPLPKELMARLGDDLYQALLDLGRLVKLSNEVVLLRETFDDFVAWLRTHLNQHGEINLAQVRDQFQTSRKYALALLEYTDEQKITRRVGDMRVLR